MKPLLVALALLAAMPASAAERTKQRERYSCRLYADARRQCAFGICDERRLRRLEWECVRDGGRP
ncbi:MAG: hypothetical protein J2P54_23925 [Bradyrhizobiaceae bacterium]|nr:hypothetical protein [Bradyrhizobiaceae bacterium]